MFCKSFSMMICLLLLTRVFPAVQSRRGGGFGRGGGGRGAAWGGGSVGRVGWGVGSGHPHHAPPAHTGGSSGHSAGHAGWGVGSGHPHHAPPAHTGVSSGHSAGKVAGAAAAGALGGMLIGHGLSSMAQPGYGHGYGYGGYGHGYGHGHGHHRHEVHGTGHSEDDAAEFRNETDMDYYMGAANAGPICSCVMVFASVMSLLLGHFLS